jgi:L-fuculose-phosphate aldolase
MTLLTGAVLNNAHAHASGSTATTSLKGALALAVEVESLCEQYCRVLQIGAPIFLSDEEMNVVLDKFKGCGQHG